MSCNEWKEYILNDICDVGSSKRIFAKEYKDEGIPFYRSKEIIELASKQDVNTELFISREKFNEIDDKFGSPTKGDILIASIGANMGISYCVDLNYKFYFKDGNVTWLKNFSKDINSRYIYYWITTPYIQEVLKNVAIGSAQKAITIDSLRKLHIKIPSLLEQDRVVGILSALDKKIEVNSEMNKTLEEMAQALFKRWFVDFEFPNEAGEPYKSSGGEMVESELGMIPKGWRVSSLDNIANYLNGLAMQKYRPESDEFIPVIKIKDLGNGRTDNSSDKASINIPKQYIINDGDVIFSWSGTLMVKIWTGGIGGLNQHLFKVTSEEYDKWYYYLWTNYHLEKFKAIAKDKATTMGHIKRSNLTEARVLVPDVDVYIRLNNIMKPIIDKIIEVNVQSKQLSELRNSLLPKLMSGEIRVEDIEVNL